MCGVTANIRDCHRVERGPGHTQTPQLPVASPCVALNTSVASRQSSGPITQDILEDRGSNHNQDVGDLFE
jgi:hypothetical protein